LPADLFEIWNPEDPTKGEFHIRYYTVNTPQGMEKVRYKIWGGPAEGNAVSPETFEAIQLVFLGALRDVETEMRPMKTSRLASLFGSVTNTPESRNEIIDVLRKANDDILAKQSVKKVREIVNDNLAIVVVALFPVIWTIALLNHTAYHWFFTYRISMITSFASIIVSIYIFQPRKKKKKKYKPEKLRII
jgi:hypothetical protein